MAKKKKPLPYPKSFFLILAVLVVVFFGGKYYHIQTYETTTSLTPTPTPSPETAMLANIAVWYPSAPWARPAVTTQETLYGKLPGEIMTATVSSKTASLYHFEQEEALKNFGFLPDLSLAAGGPGSAMWGYTKKDNGKTQIIVFSYKTQPTSSKPNQPLQFDCPCNINASVFISTPFIQK